MSDPAAETERNCPVSLSPSRGTTMPRPPDNATRSAVHKLTGANSLSHHLKAVIPGYLLQAPSFRLVACHPVLEETELMDPVDGLGATGDIQFIEDATQVCF